MNKTYEELLNKGTLEDKKQKQQFEDALKELHKNRNAQKFEGDIKNIFSINDKIIHIMLFEEENWNTIYDITTKKFNLFKLTEELCIKHGKTN